MAPLSPRVVGAEKKPEDIFNHISVRLRQLQGPGDILLLLDTTSEICNIGTFFDPVEGVLRAVAKTRLKLRSTEWYSLKIRLVLKPCGICFPFPTWMAEGVLLSARFLSIELKTPKVSSFKKDSTKDAKRDMATVYRLFALDQNDSIRFVNTVLDQASGSE